jgi:hypothetical protein
MIASEQSLAMPVMGTDSNHFFDKQTATMAAPQRAGELQGRRQVLATVAI